MFKKSLLVRTFTIASTARCSSVNDDQSTSTSQVLKRGLCSRCIHHLSSFCSAKKPAYSQRFLLDDWWHKKGTVEALVTSHVMPDWSRLTSDRFIFFNSLFSYPTFLSQLLPSNFTYSILFFALVPETWYATAKWAFFSCRNKFLRLLFYFYVRIVT